MKIFDFECTKCGFIEERMVKTADTTPDCNKCGHHTKKLLCAPGMVKTPFTGGRQATR